LQERSLNIVYFINKYGLDFIQHLKDNINIDVFEHQLIETNFETSVPQVAANPESVS